MKKKKAPVFLICYLCFMAVCIVFWVFVVKYVNRCLVRYEAAQPERVVEKVADMIQSDGVNSVFAVKEAFNQFESVDFLSQYYDDSVAGKTIIWKQDKTNYNPNKPVYRFYADEEKIGTLTLRETSSEPLMVFLTLGEWEVESAEPVMEPGQQSVTILVPDSCRVLVNGVELGEGEFTDRVIVPEQFQYVQDYLKVPELKEYYVGGLLAKPEVTILDEKGDPVDYKETCEGDSTQILRDEFPSAEMPEELSKMVLENAERYTNFQSRDLPGCTVSTKPIADMFPADSIYLAQAEQYRREDMWMYSGHGAPRFENESVTNYVPYTDELFSCDVYFDKHMNLNRNGELKIETFHMRLFYGLFDGKWKILDMQTLLD